MISRELLKEVLGLKEVTGSELLKNNMLRVFITDKCDCVDDINIYELAHKCKEWAYDNGYMMRLENHYKNSIKIEIRKPVANSKYLEYWKTTFKTEYEAIFRVCDWILQNKETI